LSSAGFVTGWTVSPTLTRVLAFTSCWVYIIVSNGSWDDISVPIEFFIASVTLFRCNGCFNKSFLFCAPVNGYTLITA
jgi:hypothetical protein